MASRSAVLQIIVAGLAATLVIGTLVVAVGRHVGTDEAIRNATQVTRLAGAGFVEPLLDDALLRGDPGAMHRLDVSVRKDVLRDGIVRVKLWSPDGRIIYSDEPRLIGRRFRLDPEEQRALTGRGAAHAEVSALGGSENAFESRAHRLLEVYAPVHMRDGRPLGFETYQRFSSVAASGQRLWLAFAPALLGGLVLLLLVTVPLGRAVARRLRDGQAERDALLRRALDASETERRLIAADLHDGVVQDLVGTSYALAAQADRVNGQADEASGVALRQGAAATRDSIRALRTLLVDIYPPSLQRDGLAAALADLAATCCARGTATVVETTEPVVLDPATERLLFRCAQEAVRNISKHAQAGTAVIALRPTGQGSVVMEVSDDGRGFDPAALGRWRRDGHFGLHLLHDLVGDAGGRIDLTAKPAGGTRLRVELPA